MRNGHNIHHSSNQEYLEMTANTLQPNETATASSLPEVAAIEMMALLRFSPDALLVVDQAGIVVLINEQAATLLGYYPAELVGQPLEVLLPECLHELHASHRAHYFAQPHSRPMGVGLDLVGRRKDGREFAVDISLRPLLLEQRIHVVAAIRDVTALRLLERERAQQAERLLVQRTLLNQAHDAILVRDPISRVSSWNRGAQELYGWSEEEALGRVSHSLLQTRFPSSRAEVEEHLECEDRWEGELIHTRRDGSTIVVESRQVVVRDAHGTLTAILEINRDITQRRQLEQAQSTAYAQILAQRTFLQRILNALPVSVSVVQERDARLVLTNQASGSIWGAVWPVGQAMQTFLERHQIHIVDERGRDFPPESWATMRALHHGETVVQHQEIIRRKGGTSVPILVNAVPLVSSHWPSTPGHESQGGGNLPEAHEPLALVIHQDVHRLKEAEYLKDEFIGIAAHELRLPLAVLKGAVGTLLLQTSRGHGPSLAEWQEEMLHDLEQATDRLTDLTDNLLDISRLQAGQFCLQRTPTNVVSLIQRVVERLQQTTTRHPLHVHTAQATLQASIDPRRIEQVLTNLVSNAIKYSPLGGPIEVSVECAKDSPLVEIQVQDRGMGIPRHQQAQIFGRFMRAENAQAAGINGTGLGLYLCRALVEQHEGHLWFTSVEGEGTTFFLTLPLVTPSGSDLLPSPRLLDDPPL